MCWNTVKYNLAVETAKNNSTGHWHLDVMGLYRNGPSPQGNNQPNQNPEIKTAKRSWTWTDFASFLSISLFLKFRGIYTSIMHMPHVQVQSVNL